MVIRSHDGLGKGSVYVTPSVGDSRRTERDGIPCSGNNRYIDRPKKGPGRERECERERQKKKKGSTLERSIAASGIWEVLGKV